MRSCSLSVSACSGAPDVQLEWEERKSRLRETKESQQKEWGRQAEAAAEEENQRLLRQMPPLPAEQPAPWMGEPQQPAPCKACPFCGAAAPHDAPRCPYCGKTLVVALPAAEEARRAGPQFVVGAPPDAYRGRVDDYPPAAASNGCLSVFGNVLWVTFGGGLLLFLMYLMGGVTLSDRSGHPLRHPVHQDRPAGLASVWQAGRA